MGRYRRTASAAIATAACSVALYPIFTGISWFWAGVGATVVVALAGTLTRLRRLPVVACLAVGLLGLLLYLNLIFEHSWSFLALIPTPSSLRHLWDLAGQGITQSRGYAPPVPELAGMVLLATAGIGLTALLTDLVAVRLRSAALAGLPLLLLFTEPFTLSVSRGWLGTTTVFCLATAGYLTMLSTEGRERIREWEQPRPGPRATDPDTRTLAAAGRRVGLASVVLALFVPLFVPGLHATRLFGNGSPGIGGALGGGPGGVGFPDPQTELSRELRASPATPVLQYTTTTASPDYLQVYVLDNLTATGWQLFGQPESLAPVGPRMPLAPGLADATGAQYVTTTITVGKDVAQDALLALPAPYPAVTVRAQGAVRADRDSLMIFDNGAQLAGLNYAVTSADVQPSEQSLTDASPAPGDIRTHYLEVPPSYDALRSLADEVTVGAATPYAKAVALQDWFTEGNFTYSLTAPSITNAAGLASFLENTHVGYCQQFSYAMAVLARLVGIPSRIAYGFTQGTEQKNGQWVVTTHDAHAWPELYFQGSGWLRFEPTPGGANGQGSATAPSYTQQQSSAATSVPTGPTSTATSPATGTGSKTSQSTRNRAGQFLAGGGGDVPPGAGAPGGPNPWALGALSLLGLLVLVTLVPSGARLVIRRRRWRAGARGGDAGLARAAWLELRDDLTDYRAGCVASESPRALAARVTARLDAARRATDARPNTDAGAALRRVTMAAERAQYSAHPASGATLRHDSAVVRRAIAASVPRRTRWRARVFPSSVVVPAALTLNQATDAFGRLSLSRRQGLSAGHRGYRAGRRLPRRAA